MHTISTLLHSPCALSISINVAMFMWMGTPCRQCTWSFKFITYGQLIKISLTFVPHTHAFIHSIIHSITHSLALWCMRRLMWDVCNMEYGSSMVTTHKIYFRKHKIYVFSSYFFGNKFIYLFFCFSYLWPAVDRKEVMFIIRYMFEHFIHAITDYDRNRNWNHFLFCCVTFFFLFSIL